MHVKQYLYSRQIENSIGPFNLTKLFDLFADVTSNPHRQENRRHPSEDNLVTGFLFIHWSLNKWRVTNYVLNFFIIILDL